MYSNMSQHRLLDIRPLKFVGPANNCVNFFFVRRISLNLYIRVCHNSIPVLGKSWLI